MNIKLTKIGQFFKGNYHTQYPAPYVFKETLTGLPRLRVYYTGRIENQSLPCFADFDNKLKLISQHEAILPLGKSGEFDEHGISIQFQSNNTVWYTGYSKKVSTPYQTMIGTAEWQKSGSLAKTGICMGLSRRNPLSVCTPCIVNTEKHGSVFLYNTHTSWDTESNPKEAMYCIKGQTVQDVWSPTISPYHEVFIKAGSDHSYARPWGFKLGNIDVIAYSYRGNYGHREDPSKSYKVGFYDLTNKRQIFHEEVGMDQDFMVAYLVTFQLEDKIYFLYNNSYDSPIQYGELTYEL